MNKKKTMQLGMIGLGRMGANMVRRLIKGGHECVVFNRSPGPVKELVKEKAVGASSLADFISVGARSVGISVAATVLRASMRANMRRQQGIRSLPVSSRVRAGSSITRRGG